MSKRFLVLGNPIAHSRSPAIHAAFAAQTGIALAYERKEIPLGQFNEHLRALQADGVSGVNVTVPFKVDAFNFANDGAARVTARAALAQAVNTLHFSGAEIVADNTDGAGLVADITQNLHCPLQGKTVLLLGAGGAALGAAGSLLEAQVARLYVLNRSVNKALALAAQFTHLGAISALTTANATSIKFDVIINATSAGLTPTDSAPIWAGLQLNAGGLAYDMMYGAQPTAFMAAFQPSSALTPDSENCIRCSDGLGMLVEQAAEAFYLWHGLRPKTADVIRQIRTQIRADLMALPTLKRTPNPAANET